MAVPVVVFTALAVVGAGRAMWLDETFSLAATRDLGPALQAGRGNMVLYYLLATGWSSVSGSVLWLRLLSLALMAGAVAGFTMLVSRQWDLRVTRWSALFAATSYGIVQYGQEARSYALVCLLVVGSWLAVDHAAEHPDRRSAWLAHGIACALLPLAHGLSVLQLAAQVAALVVAGVGAHVWRRAVLNFGISVGVLAALTVLGLGVNGTWMEPMTWASARDLVLYLFGPWLIPALVLLALTLTGAGWALAEARRRPPGLGRFRALMPLSWGLVSVVLVLMVSVARPSQLPRYTIPSCFGIALLMALGAIAIARRSPKLSLAPLATLALLMVGQVVLHLPAASGWDEAVDVVASQGRSTDSIAFASAHARLPFDAVWLGRSDPPAVVLVGLPGELGSLHRTITIEPVHRTAESFGDAERVWIVDKPYPGLVGRLDALLNDPLVRDGFREEGRWTLPEDVRVVLLVRR